MQRSTRDRLASEIRGHLRDRSAAKAPEVATNPVSDYTDGRHLEREIDGLFRRFPVVFGHASEVASPRDVATRDLAGVPVLVARQDDGSVAAFLNVCRHRGAKVVVEPCGRHAAFTCPYHAWTYRLDGSLARITNAADFGEVDPSDMGLVRLAAEERHGLLWIMLTPGVPIDVAAHLGDELDDELATYGLGGFVVERSHRTTAPMNWKVVVDGFLETYHLGVLHRTTIGPHIRSNLAPFRPLGPHGCMTAVRTSFDRILDDPSADPAPHLVHAYQIFPNTVLVWSGYHFEAWLTFPTDRPETSDVTVQVLGRAAHVAETTDYWDKNWQVVRDTVLTEDFTIGESIQRGFRSGAQAQLTFGRNEPGVQHFHHWLRTSLVP